MHVYRNNPGHDEGLPRQDECTQKREFLPYRQPD